MEISDEHPWTENKTKTKIKTKTKTKSKSKSKSKSKTRTKRKTIKSKKTYQPTNIKSKTKTKTKIQAMFDKNRSKKPTDVLYIWVSHGDSIPNSNKHYLVETKFKVIGFYSEPLQAIGIGPIQQILESPCSAVDIFKIKKQTNNHVYLPPLVFSIEPNDHELIIKYTGLYRLEYSFYNKTCHALKTEKLLSHADFLQQFSNIEHITYSLIFKTITDMCKVKGDIPSDTSVSIYSCQSPHKDYVQMYSPKSNPEQETHVVEPVHAMIVNQLQMNEKASLLLLPVNYVPKTWAPLAKLKHQGCALNVLSFYQVLDENYAREKAVCLSLKGTSIYKIVDYIHQYNPIPEYKYIIMRMPILTGLSIILNKLFESNADLGVIFKLYASNTHKNNINHVGHSVSIMIDNNNMHFVDPQSQIYLSIPDNSETSIAQIMHHYAKFHYMDLIYFISDDIYYPDVTHQDLNGLNEIYILPAMDDPVYYNISGGKH